MYVYVCYICPVGLHIKGGISQGISNYNNYAFRALRAHLLFQLLIVALSLNIFSLYSIKRKQKKFADFIIFFCAFSKFFKNKNF